MKSKVLALQLFYRVDTLTPPPHASLPIRLFPVPFSHLSPFTMIDTFNQVIFHYMMLPVQTSLVLHTCGQVFSACALPKKKQKKKTFVGKS